MKVGKQANYIHIYYVDSFLDNKYISFHFYLTLGQRDLKYFRIQLWSYKSSLISSGRGFQVHIVYITRGRCRVSTNTALKLSNRQKQKTV